MAERRRAVAEREGGAVQNSEKQATTPKIPATTWPAWRRISSTSGARGGFASLSEAANSSVSPRWVRTQSPSHTSGTLSRNGTRQPQSANCSGVRPG